VPYVRVRMGAGDAGHPRVRSPGAHFHRQSADTQYEARAAPEPREGWAAGVAPYHPGVIAKLPLNSSLWEGLSACYSRQNAVTRLREVVEGRELGEAWQSLLGEILHQGTVYGVTSAAIPHLVDLAPDLPAASRRELWIEIGLLTTAGAGRFPSPPAPGLQEGLTAALRTAEVLAVRDFLAGDIPAADDDCYFALTCVALAGHPVGRALWKFPSPSSGCIQMSCPQCQVVCKADGFGDPLALPCPVPHFGSAPTVAGQWGGIADALERARADQVMGPGWGRFLGTARQVALAGVPAGAPRSAVWCLVAAMVATRSPASAPSARTLARLTGHMRCLHCGGVWAIADALDDTVGARPVDVADARLPDGYVQDALFQASGHDAEDGTAGGVWPETVADADAGFRPAPGRTLRDAGLSGRLLWSAGRGPVRALALVAARQTPVIAAGEGTRITLRDVGSGAEAGPRLPGTAGPVASVALPDGTTVVAAPGAGGGVTWRDAATGRQLDGGHAPSRAPVMSLAPVVMPANPNRAYPPLARLAGRTVLAAGDADGVVRLWDPADRVPLPPLFRRPGRPVVSLTPADLVNQPPWDGTDLVALYGDLLVDVWGSAAVHGRPSTSAPRTGKLAAAGHQRVTAAAVSPRRIGHRRPVLLADRNGTVSMWETFGVRLCDPLPPDPAHRDVNAIAVLPGPGDAITVVTASHTDSSLRAWQPATGSATLLPIDARPRCLLAVGETLIIGHDAGLLALYLTGQA
jgi:hypothetical protein